jgi:CheY-like chemotaxis protein
VEAGKVDFHEAPFRLRELAGEAVAMVRPAAAAKGLGVEVKVDPLLPVHVTGDAGRIRQVLLNLLSNAVKFTTTGAIGLEVSPATPGLYGDSRIMFRVWDTGRGIPAEALKKLFVPFEQVDSKADPKLGGAGLGLSISKKLIESMEGSLAVAPKDPGPGTCFKFQLTLAESAIADREESRESESTVVDVGLKILLCEDNPINQRVAMHMLDRLGHHVELAENGTRAVEKAQQADYDLILMDCQMPEMDGFEASRQIRALATACARAPIIALTASAFADDVEMCRKAGMTGHLAKPVTMEDLREAISQAASHRV